MRRLFALVVMLAATAVACGSGGEAQLTKGTPGSTAAPKENVGTRPPGAVADINKAACDVLTPDDVAATLGNRVRPGQGTGKFCQWGTAVDKGTSANLTVNRADQCNPIRNSLPKEAKTESVGGVGNSAVWNWQEVSILLQGNFVVCWPDAVIWIAVSGEKDQAALREEASTLAQKAHNKL
ncbi:MAG: hypothetical protein ACRD12_19345 [Acidimicrobiales bacterium]